MKNLKKALQAITRELKTLAGKTEKISKAVDKLEKAKVAKKQKTKSKAKTKRKVTAKRKITAKKKVTAKKKTTALTDTDKVLNIIKRSKKGVDAPTLIKKTGLADKQIRNILFRTYKQGKIKRAGRGSYVGG